MCKYLCLLIMFVSVCVSAYLDRSKFDSSASWRACRRNKRLRPCSNDTNLHRLSSFFVAAAVVAAVLVAAEKVS